jgi:DNA repair exonuclease SbcCD ATPase subunit
MKTIWIGVFAALGAAGCMVPASRYEEARSAIVVEQEAHRRTQDRLSQISRDLDRLHASLAEREKKVATLEGDLSEAQLSADVAGTERRFATEIVEQLRGELLRTGDHLRDMSGEKTKLAQALEAAESRAKKLAACEAAAADNAAIVRDLSVALHAPIHAGEVELVVVDGRAVLRVASAELGGEVMQETGRKVVAAIAAVTQTRADTRVSIRETGEGGGSEESAKRLRAVSEALVKAGLGAARVELAPATAAGKGAATLELGVWDAGE